MSTFSSIELCNGISLEDFLIAHTELLREIGEPTLSKFKSYGDFYKYIHYGSGSFYELSDQLLCYRKCDKLNMSYGNIEKLLKGKYLRHSNWSLYHYFENPEIDFRCLDFSFSDLSGSVMCGIDLSCSNFFGTLFVGSYFKGAKLTNCKISSDTDFRCACFVDTIDPPLIPMACPSEGSFIGWKRVGKYIVKLQIPDDAKRSSATSEKCRCDKALVLGIYNLNGLDSGLSEVYSPKRQNFFGNVITEPITYTVGEIVYPDSFDENRWDECSNGIHFFVDRRSAEQYSDGLREVKEDEGGQLHE